MSASPHQRLHDADPAVRGAALDALAASAAPDVFAEAAAAHLADDDPGVRDLAARLLVEHHTASTARHVASHIESGDITVRNLAGEVLVELGPSALEPLAPFVDDADADVRKFAIDLLAQLPAERLATRIAERLDDEDGNVRLAAVEALGALRAHAHAGALYDLYDRDPLARPNVVTALGYFGRSEDLPVLARALEDDDPVVRLAAADALATHDAPGTRRLLVDGIDEADPLVRPLLMQALVAFQDSHSWPPMPDHFRGYLLDMLAHDDDDDRCAAARGLQAFLDGDVVDALLGVAGRSDTLDVTIFQTIVQYPEAAEHVARAADEGTLPVDTAAAFVLALLGQDAVTGSGCAAAAGLLADHLNALDVDTRLTALGLCGQAEHPAFRDVLRAGMNDPDPAISTFAADAAADAGLGALAAPPTVDAGGA